MICRPRRRSCRSRPSSAATSPGSGWKEYQATGRRLRHPAAGRPARERPAARADLHAGDQGRAGRARREHRPSTDDRAHRLVAAIGAGDALAERDPRRGARAVPATARPSPSGAGILLADTKFEFGVDRRRRASSLLIDEVLTPDSSRFWDAATYEPGRPRRASTSSSCATGSRPSRGTRRRPGPELPDGRRRGHARPLRRGVRADHRRQLRALSRRRT